MKKLSELTSEFVYHAYHLSDDMVFSCEEVPADLLVNRNRLDLMAKVLYLKLRETAPAYAEKLYLEHIRIMTKGSFVEAGSTKTGKAAFIDAFNTLFEGMKHSGYSADALPVPVDEDMQAMDGAHRIACALMLGIPVKIIRLPVKAEFDRYSYEWFRERGIEEWCLDQMVLEYVHRKQTACLNLWPSAKGHDAEVEKMLEERFGIVYKKEVSLNENGAFHYLAQIYSEYSWAQDHDGDGFSGVYRKLLPCFPTFDPVKVYFTDIKDYAEMTAAKENLRDLFGLEKHSMHATDNLKETESMAELLLSENSIDFMNHCQSTKFRNTFELLEQGDHFDYQRTVLTGSIVLALYGIRQAEDLDFISMDDIPGSHNHLLEYYGMSASEAVTDPENWFIYFDRKFMTLENIRRFKKKRNEGKDRDDLALIEALAKNAGRPDLKVKLLQTKRRAVANIQGVILRAAHKTGTYDILRKVYRTLKGQKV
ncbi:MAG: hypothetical protein K6F23_09160 [Solobacterium sp.]|nr:hypothetical protein [Solobacterium sp.]